MESINADSADNADNATEQEPNLAQSVDVQVERPIPNPMFDVVTLEIKPFSSANKDNGVRDLLLWNQLWGLVSMPPYPAHVLHLTPFLQVRSQEQLPVDTTVKDEIPLGKTAELLGMECIQLWRYFWGLRRYKGGKPLLKDGSQITLAEKSLRLKFKAFSNWPVVIAAAPKVTAEKELTPAERRAEPRHTCKTPSGFAAIYDFGDSKAQGTNNVFWQYKNHLRPDQPALQLRPGMRGRHVFGPRSSGVLVGRCFEWWISRGPVNCGAPVWKLSEFVLGIDGFRRSSKRVTASSPFMLWRQMSAHLNLPPIEHGAALCGLADPSLAELIAVAQPNQSSRFGTQFEDMTTRTQRLLAAQASKAFTRSMQAVCPHDPKLAFKALRQSASWQAEWCDEDDGYEFLADLPFVKGMVDAHSHAPKESKIGILSLFAPHFPHSVTIKFFGVSTTQVTAAKLHNADGMAGVPAEKEQFQRMRLSGRTFAFMHQWCRSTYAVTAGDASDSNLKRLQIRSRLYPIYKAMAKRELGVEAVSVDHFNRHMKDGFVDETLESCCCGGCVDGWTALSMLREFVMDPQYEFAMRKEMAERIDQIQDFLRGDYRWKHLQEESREVNHCMQCALGCDCSSLSEACDHEHTNQCVECNMLPVLIMQMEQHMNELGQRRLKAIQDAESCVGYAWEDWHRRNDSKLHAVPEGMIHGSRHWSKWHASGCPESSIQVDSTPVAIERQALLHESMTAHLGMLVGEIKRYQGHLVRKHKASQGQMDLVSLITYLRCLIFIDYKMKVLPCETKEAQAKIFGKRGKSLFGMVVMFQLPPNFTGEVPDGIDIDGDFAVAYFRGCADDADQDFNHSVQCFEIGCKFIKQKYPWITEAMLYSDGAGNFRSLSFEILMAQRIAKVGIKVVCHLLPEAGDGKDRVDRDFAGVNKLFASWLKQPGASMQNAVEMVKALEYGKKDKGSGVINCALEIDRSVTTTGVNTAAFTKLVHKARDNMYYTEFGYGVAEGGGLFLSGARFYSYYKMGTGVHLTMAQMESLWPDQPELPSARIIYGDNLTSVQPEMAPKMEQSAAHKKEKKEGLAEKRRERQRKQQEEAKHAQAALEARQTSLRCCTCDRSFLVFRFWRSHSLVCKQKGRKKTRKDREQEHDATEKFNSLQGHALAVSCDGDFPVPQFDGYEFIYCRRSWKEKILFMELPEYAMACAVVAAIGWATKEQCRRPSVPFPKDVKAELRLCFDHIPRMNNYEIHLRLRDRYQLGPKVLRMNQIAGWITSELKRRKEAALGATNKAANLIEQSGGAAGGGNCSAFSDFLAAIRQQDFERDILPAWKQTFRRQKSDFVKQQHELALMSWEEKDQKAHMLRKCACYKRKRSNAAARLKQPNNKRKDLATSQKPQQEQCKEPAKTADTPGEKLRKTLEKTGGKKQQSAKIGGKKHQPEKTVGKKQQCTKRKGSVGVGASAEEGARAEKSVVESNNPQPALMPGQAWCNCCGAAVAETELDREKICTDQAACSERLGRRGKRKRKPKAR